MDHFSLSYTAITPTLDSAYVTQSGVPNNSLLPSSDRIPSLLREQYVSPSICAYLSDLISTLRHHPLLEGRMITTRSSSDLDTLSRLWSLFSKSSVYGTDGSRSAVLPEDVLAVLIGVTAHRLKMRRPDKEKSTFWGSNVEALRQRRFDGKRGVLKSVEDVIREVAAVV